MRMSTVAVMLSILGLGSEAAAQTQGGLRISVDRLFGFTYNTLTLGRESTSGGITSTVETSLDWVGFNLIGGGFSGVGLQSEIAGLTSQTPRLAFDYELPSHLTIGASAFLAVSSLTDDDNDEFSTFGFGLAPRVGFSITLNDRLSFWPRAGFTIAYYSSTVTNNPSGSSSSTTTSRASTVWVPVWLNIEPTMVFMPAQHFGFTASLICDVPLTGGRTTASTITSGGTSRMLSTDSSLTQFSFGLQFGVMGRI